MEETQKIYCYKKAFLDTLTQHLLTSAQGFSKSRGCEIIREQDVRFAMRAFSANLPPRPKFYRIPVQGDGACLCT
jgi:hypothetical protein